MSCGEWVGMICLWSALKNGLGAYHGVCPAVAHAHARAVPATGRQGLAMPGQCGKVLQPKCLRKEVG